MYVALESLVVLEDDECCVIPDSSFYIDYGDASGGGMITCTLGFPGS